MTRFLRVLMVLACAACGRGELMKSGSSLTTSTSSLVGTYELGPDTAHGIAGTPGRFGRLSIHADGTFDVSFFPGGCVMYLGSGTWEAMPLGAQLTLESGGWLLNPYTNAQVQTVLLDPTEGGATVTGLGVTQQWVLTAAGE